MRDSVNINWEILVLDWREGRSPCCDNTDRSTRWATHRSRGPSDGFMLELQQECEGECLQCSVLRVEWIDTLRGEASQTLEWFNPSSTEGSANIRVVTVPNLAAIISQLIIHNSCTRVPNLYVGTNEKFSGNIIYAINYKLCNHASETLRSNTIFTITIKNGLYHCHIHCEIICKFERHYGCFVL